MATITHGEWQARKDYLNAKKRYFCVPKQIGINWGLFSVEFSFSFDTEKELIYHDLGATFENMNTHLEVEKYIFENGGFEVSENFDPNNIEHVRQYSHKLPQAYKDWFNDID